MENSGRSKRKPTPTFRPSWRKPALLGVGYSEDEEVDELIRSISGNKAGTRSTGEAPPPKQKREAGSTEMTNPWSTKPKRRAS